MRCIHCGKEIRDGVVFCIYCDRPVRKEYAHYACEFYDSISISERIANIFANISSLNYGNNQKHFSESKYRNNTISFKTKAMETLNTVKSTYSSYIQSSNSTNTNEKSEQNKNIKKLETDSNQTVVADNYIKLDEIADSSKESIKKFIGSSKEDKKTVATGLVIIFIIIKFIFAINN